MPLFVIKNEYIDKKLKRRIGVGEELELSVERVNELKAIGVRVEPIRTAPAETATISEGEKGSGKRGKGPKST